MTQTPETILIHSDFLDNYIGGNTIGHIATGLSLFNRNNLWLFLGMCSFFVSYL